MVSAGELPGDGREHLARRRLARHQGRDPAKRPCSSARRACSSWLAAFAMAVAMSSVKPARRTSMSDGGVSRLHHQPATAPHRRRRRRSAQPCRPGCPGDARQSPPARPPRSRPQAPPGPARRTAAASEKSSSGAGPKGGSGCPARCQPGCSRTSSSDR